MVANITTEATMLKIMRSFIGHGWAMPVVSRRHAAAASGWELVKRASGYRLGVQRGHAAWERAVGVAPLAAT